MFDDIIKAAKQNSGVPETEEKQKKLELADIAESLPPQAETHATESPKPVHDDTPKQATDDSSVVRISVIGIGGAGCNCVDRLSRSGIKSARTIAMNTDGKHLNMVECTKKILIGKTITKGLGAGGNADLAKKCAEVDRKKLTDEIGENEIVFLCAGMGGGTGSGVSPVVAQIAKEQGAIVIAIVTYPFALERVRLKKAQEALQNLVKYADTVVVIDNNRLSTYVPNLPINKAFELADSITARAVMGITDTIMFPSLINIDFADVRSIMQGSGLALISLGEGSGVNKVDDVVKDTLEHPLLDVSYEGATGSLIHIEGGPDLTLGDAIKVGEKITSQFDSAANVKVGARVNHSSSDTIRVTAIITGVKSPYILKNVEPSSSNPVEETIQYL